MRMVRNPETGEITYMLNEVGEDYAPWIADPSNYMGEIAAWQIPMPRLMQ